MRLLRLLAAGKSLVGIKEKSGRYRLSSASALPKFEAAAHPFRATARPSAEGVLEKAQDDRTNPDLEPAQMTTVPEEPGHEPEEPAGIPVPVCLADKRGEAGRFKRMVASLWPDRGAQGRGARRAVQGELQLDQVKVVRNDLTDTDLEVVHKRPGKAKEKAPTEERAMSNGKTDEIGAATGNR